MREVEGLQSEPAYPTVGLWLCASEGDHVQLEGAQPVRKLAEAPLKRGDGCLFVSERRHNVTRIDGCRKSFVIELWDGPPTEFNRHQ